MREQEILSAIDKAISHARNEVYELLDINEPLGERLDAKFRDASKMVETRRKAIDRRRKQLSVLPGALHPYLRNAPRRVNRRQ